MIDPKPPLFGTCTGMLVCGLVVGALLQPVAINRFLGEWYISDFSIPIGGAVGFLFGIVAEQIEFAIARKRSRKESPVAPPISESPQN